MIADRRRSAILEATRAMGAVSIHDLVAITGSSQATVRRDLKVLEEGGHLERTHGGAVANGRFALEPSFEEKSSVAADAKAAIAAEAVKLVNDGDAILIGVGSTTREFARRLTGFHDLAVVTNSLMVARALAGSRVDVTVTGGSLRGATFALIGAAAEASLGGIRVNRTFMSGNGLTPERGLSTPNFQVAATDRAIAAAASEVVVLADHTKLGHETMCQTVPPERIARLITDEASDKAMLDRFRDLGVSVHVAR